MAIYIYMNIIYLIYNIFFENNFILFFENIFLIVNFFIDYFINLDNWSILYDVILSYFGVLIFIPYINYFLIFTTLLFFIGLGGLLFGRKNLIYLLLCYEIISLSIILDFFYASVYTHRGDGFVFGLLIIALAAIESTVGLSIIVAYYRRFGNTSLYLKHKSNGNI